MKPITDLLQGLTLLPKLNGFASLILCQLGALVFLSGHWRDNLSPLSHHIGVVISMGAQEEVVGVYARRVVAFVADEQASGDGTEVNLPGDSMRCDGAFIWLSHSHLAISENVRAPGPQPAAIRFFDVRKEPFGERLSGTFRPTLARAIFLARAEREEMFLADGTIAPEIRTSFLHSDLHGLGATGPGVDAPRSHFRFRNYSKFTVSCASAGEPL